MITREILHLPRVGVGIGHNLKIQLPFKSVVIGWNLFAFIICFLIAVSQPRPIERPRFNVDRFQTFNHGNSSSSLVRVIVSSSSSSSRSSAGGHSFHRPIFHDISPANPTLQPIHVQPTTYHPQLPHFFPAFRQHHHQYRTNTKAFQSHQSPPLLQRPQHLIQLTSIPHQQQPKDDILSAFYRVFSHQSGQTFAVPVYPAPLSTERLVSIVSQTQSVTTSEVPYRQKPTNRNFSRAQQIQRRYDHEIDHQIYDEHQHFKDPGIKKVNEGHETKFELPRAEQLVMYQRDQDYDFQSDQPITTSPPVQPSTQHWEESEKVWAEPEQVWATPEMNWEKEDVTQKWEPGKEDLTSTTPTPAATVSNCETDEDSSVRFYELGEDENDEPKELILDKNAMQTTIESAQLAARSWELPELSHLTHIPSQSFVRSAAMTDGMTAESVHIPTTLSMSKVRMTLDGGVKWKSNNSNPQDSRSTPSLQTSTNGNAGKKFGYVLDGSNVRKYRVEERTPDGYIVGEYGVLNHNNGFLRGVRYTADGTINPRLIHEALMKFLSL